MTAIEPTSAYIGYSVRTRDGDELGTVTDFVLDAEATRVCYAVLTAREGVLGLRHKKFAIPYRDLELDTENECFVADLAEESLRDARELAHEDGDERAASGRPAAYRYHGIDAVRRGAP